MNPGKNKRIVFFGVIIILLSLPLYFILRSESMLGDPQNIYRFRPFRLIDPHDFMRGDYLIIDFDTRVRLEEGSRPGRGQDVFVVVEKDSAGYAFFDYATVAQPEQSNYFITKALSQWSNDELWIEIPFDKYYINENNARLAEMIYEMEVRSDTTTMYIEVAIKDGEALLKDIYLQDTPLNKFINDLSEAERTEIEEIYKSGNFRRRLRLFR